MDRDEMIGANLGSYRVTSKLGQGGMGAVYLAEHPVLGRKAAIKVLLPELSQQKEAVERFFDEARTTARLRHPAMVDVYDFGNLPDGRAFLIMDFLEGECLEDRIRNRGALPVAEALGIARQIALGVSVAHGEHIVHRDLKPDNIFLLPPVPGSPEERVKILDFGIAKLARRTGGAAMTLAGVVIGTPLYMSPEQCRGDIEVDYRADVYSLGCILFTMLAGRQPFLSESMLELIALHQHGRPPKLAELGIAVDAAVEQLVATMLAKAPADRFSSMLGVAETIEALLAGKRTATPRSGVTGQAPTVLLAKSDSIAPTAVTPFLPRRNTPHAPPQPASTSGRKTLIAIVGLVAIAAAAFVALRFRAPSPAPEVTKVAPPPEPPRPAVQPPAPEVPAPPDVAVVPPPPVVRPSAKPRGARARAADSTPPAAVTPPNPAGLEREIQHSRGKPDAPARTGRPIYKGTQLDIEKKDPY